MWALSGDNVLRTAEGCDAIKPNVQAVEKNGDDVHCVCFVRV